MSRLYDTVEPAVINEEMLRSAVEEQGPKQIAGEIAKEEGINYNDVTNLRLDFRNILKVDNLWQFSTLVKLQLDNNIIEKIEGLETLVNLEWLDMSFNNIEAIEGLEKLLKLKDLTFHNNRIPTLENLDTLKDLHVLSIGNNRIEGLEQMIYLRQFANLRTLNMSGNPVCEDENYKLFAIAFLPNLVYLDFRLVDADTRNRAHAMYENKLGELMHNEKQEQNARIFEEKQKKEFAIHEKAYVERLNGPHLFDSMYAEDPEGQRLLKLPGNEESTRKYKEEFVAVCMKIFVYGLEQDSKRQEEVDTFFECMEEAKKENKDLGVTEVEEFLLYQKSTFRELLLKSDQSEQEKKMSEYNEKVSELWDVLMGYEMRLVDQLEETINNFERSLADINSVFIEHVQEYVVVLRDLENTNHERLLESAITILEKIVKLEIQESDLHELLRGLFVDKDTICNAVAASHDVHLLNIDNREDLIVTRSGTWMANLMTKIHKEESNRNRDRIEEISNFIDHVREEIYNLDLTEGDGS